MAQPRGWFQESYRHRLARYGIQTSKVKSRKDRVKRKENLWMFKDYMSKKRLSEGAKVELEHKDTVLRIERDKPSPEVAAEWIADDHKKEFSGYYPALAKMEAKLEKKQYMAKKSDFVDVDGQKYFRMDDGTYMNIRNPNDFLSDEAGERFGEDENILGSIGVFPWEAAGAVMAEQYRPIPVYAARKYNAGMRPDVELEGNRLVVRPNPIFSERVKTIELSPEEIEGFNRWKEGELIQNAFPNWSSSKRELLLTGMDDAEFKEYIGDEK